MVVIGLTGSIGMGKSTVGAMLSQLGIPVHEADHAVHGLLKIDSPARQALAATFPYFEYPQIYERKTKEFNRKELGDLIFKDDGLRQKLEGVLHPFVQKDQKEFIRAAQAKGLKLTALDIPLLFETGAQNRVDYTAVVSAPFHIQKQRVLARPKMTQEKFYMILERQMADVQKCKLADFVIKSGVGLAQTQKDVQIMVRTIRERHGI